MVESLGLMWKMEIFLENTSKEKKKRFTLQPLPGGEKSAR